MGDTSDPVVAGRGWFARADSNRLAFIIAVCIFAAMSVWAAKASTGFIEADACNHYVYARAALRAPRHLVDVWARPLCTGLYAIPAALGGRMGARLASLALALVSAGIVYLLAGRQKLRWPALAAIFFLAQPLVFIHSFAEMTELPFATLLIAAFLAYERRWWLLMAIVVAFAPLGRPEGFGLVIVAAIALACHRQWKWIPLLVLPVVGWDVAGWLFDGRVGPIWKWLPSHWPYSADSMYPRGPWWHFAWILPAVVSPIVFPAVLLGIWRAACPSGLRDWHLYRCRVLIALIPVGVLLVHSVLYWRGWMASNGEPRYLLTVAPFWALLAAMGWEWVFVCMGWTAALRCAVAAALVPVVLHAWAPMVPFRAVDNDQLAEFVANWYRGHASIARDYPDVISPQPALSFSLDRSPLGRDGRVIWGRPAVLHPTPGTMMLWDPVLGTISADRDHCLTENEIHAAGWVPVLSLAKGWQVYLSPTTKDGRPTIVPPAATTRPAPVTVPATAPSTIPVTQP